MIFMNEHCLVTRRGACCMNRIYSSDDFMSMYMITSHQKLVDVVAVVRLEDTEYTICLLDLITMQYVMYINTHSYVFVQTYRRHGQCE